MVIIYVPDVTKFNKTNLKGKFISKDEIFKGYIYLYVFICVLTYIYA